MNNKKFNVAAIDIDCQAESHRILNLYTRYMLKKFKFDKYNHLIFKTCPRYENYYFHINGLILKAKKKFVLSNIFFRLSSTCCKNLI